MKAKRVGSVLGVLALVGILGVAALAVAAGPGGRGMRGAGDWPHGFGGPGFAGDLTDEEIAALRQARQAFADQTRELRDKAYQKRLELKSELAKPEPDARRAADLQKEISGLDAQLDQARLEHQLKMKKENPKLYGRGFGMGMGPGFGRGPGAGAGRGGYGSGPCWQ